jgi:hypothetical protein
MAAQVTAINLLEVDDLLSMDQAQLDELYEKSGVGEIPSGDTIGTALLKPASIGRFAAVFARFFAWQGKVFDPEKGELLNKLTPFGIRSVRARVYVGLSQQVKGGQAIIIDYS